MGRCRRVPRYLHRPECLVFGVRRVQEQLQIGPIPRPPSRRQLRFVKYQGSVTRFYNLSDSAKLQHSYTYLPETPIALCTCSLHGRGRRLLASLRVPQGLSRGLHGRREGRLRRALGAETLEGDPWLSKQPQADSGGCPALVLGVSFPVTEALGQRAAPEAAG